MWRKRVPCLSPRTVRPHGTAKLLRLDEHGKSDFNALLFRRVQHLCFCAFDCLWLNGHDLRWQTLIERKDVLCRLLKGCPSEMRYVDISREPKVPASLKSVVPMI